MQPTLSLNSSQRHSTNALNPFMNRKVVSTPAPQFGLATLPKVSRLAKTYDFQTLANSAVKQVMLIYAFCIFSRWGAAATRSWNELRESTVMNGLGWTGWFYTTPMLLKFFLYHAVPKNKDGMPLRELVAAKTPKPEGTKWVDKLRRLNWRINPLVRYEVFSPEQLAAVKTRTLHEIEKASGSAANKTALVQKIDSQFRHALNWIRLSKGLGIISTIAFLGVGINLVNIAITNKNIAEGRIGKNRLN